MYPYWLNGIIEWIRLNPHWAYSIVLLTAAMESLAIIGLFVPGVVIMFSIGALVAADALNISTTLLLAVTGAILGDGASFWLGRHYHQQLRVVWPFCRYPRLINRGVDFFTRHGGKSVLFARFVGPVRPILPAIAGMLNMPAGRFFAVDIVSALLWAPAYLLPGLVFGASLSVAAEVAGRLVVMLLFLVFGLWLVAWLIHRLFNYLQAHINAMINQALAWGRRHPLGQPLLGALLDPDQPEARGLAAMVLLLFLAVGAFTFLLNLSLTGIDRWVYAELTALHTPLGNQLVMAVTQLGSAWVLGPAVATTQLWLALRKNWAAFGHALAAIATAFLLVYLLKATFLINHPLPRYQVLNEFAFPSSHTALSMTVLGFWSVMIARELPHPSRWLPYSLVAILVSAIAFSRLYLGTHWLSDILGGLTLGLGVVSLFGIAYRRHPAQPLPWRSLALIAVVTMLLSASVLDIRGHDAALLETEPQTAALSVDDWWQGGWEQLPPFRIDLINDQKQPLNIQYAGTLLQLSDLLTHQGWQPSPFPDWTSTLRWLTDTDDPLTYPLLPQVHDGRHETVRWTRRSGGDGLYVLRLWPAYPNQKSTIWLGAVSKVVPEQRFKLFHFLVTTPDFDTALEYVSRHQHDGLEIREVSYPSFDRNHLLIRAKPG